MCIFLLSGINIILSYLYSCFVVLLINYIVGLILLKLQSKALNEDCDPERYLSMLEKHAKRYRLKERGLNLLAINQAAGHMSLGDLQTAKEYLTGIDTSYLSEKNGSYLTYTINLMLCYYALGDIERAESMYETHMVRLAPLGKKRIIAVDLVIGSRYYYLGKYALSYEYLDKLRTKDLNKRQYLGLIYQLALMDVMNGNTELAVKRFEKVVKFGNKLSIVKSSQEMLEKIT